MTDDPLKYQSMVARCAGLLITILVVSDLSCWAEETTEEATTISNEDAEDIQHHWLGEALGLTARRDLRADKDNMFWATRGKRNTEDADFWAIRGKKQYVKPNGLFQAISTPKRSMDLWMSEKRHGLFDSIKRAGLKPNGLFGAYKRAGLKPNGLFGSIKRSNNREYKRTGLKPNGLFGAYKRAGLKPNGLFGAYKRAGLKPNGLFGAYKRAGLKPNGLFGAYKRTLKPNGLFGMSKKSWVPTQIDGEELEDCAQKDEINEENFNLDDMDEL